MVQKAYSKEMGQLVEETGAWKPVPLEESRRLRTVLPERVLQPRPVLTLRSDDHGKEEVKCRVTLQGFKDPDVLDLPPDAPAPSAAHAL